MKKDKFKEIDKLKKLKAAGWYEIIEIDCEDLFLISGFYYQRN